jgi:hypothetical protein
MRYCYYHNITKGIEMKNTMIIVKETKYMQKTDLKGRPIMVKTIWEKNGIDGRVYSRSVAVREIRI